MKSEDIDTVLIGHPYAPIGRGEDIRCSFRALRSVCLAPRILDIYGLNERESATLAELKSVQTTELGKVNIFHINGDEVDGVLAHLPQKVRPGVYNIIYPAWELSNYPSSWARQLERFDEIWAPSQFIRKSIEAAIKQHPVVYMPLACEVRLTSFLARRHFGIPEDSYAFLFFFDFRSYVTRKNPEAVIDCFRRLLAERQYARVSLVMKFHGAEHAPKQAARLVESLSDIADRTVLLDGTMTDNEVKNLVRCCDCFVSLHRSEGFGRGLSEAMYLGKPVIATAYSGNMDFMTSQNSLLVSYRIVDVPTDAYPFWQGQVWADPDIEEATRHMVQLVDDPSAGREIGRIASLSVRKTLSYRKIGLRYSERVRTIMQQTGSDAKAIQNSEPRG